MKRAIAALGACASLAAGPAVAAAHDTSTPTAVVIAGTSEPEPRTVTVHGHLESSPECRAGRSLEVFARYGEWTHRHVWAPGEWELVERTRSGADGSFAGSMPATNIWSTKVVVPRANAGRRGHRHICGRAVGALRF